MVYIIVKVGLSAYCCMLQSHTGITLQIALLIFTQYMSQHNLDILKKTHLALSQNVLQKIHCFITV